MYTSYSKSSVNGFLKVGEEDVSPLTILHPGGNGKH